MTTPTMPALAPPAQGPSLRDIHLPAEPSWWPPAPGWWVVAGVLLAAVLVGLWWWQQRRRARRGQQRIVLELDQIVRNYSADSAARMNALHQLLRRVARRHEPMAGQQRADGWRQTLARVPVDANTLDQLLELDRLIYQPPSSFDEVATVAAVRRWLNLAVNPRQWKPVALEQSDA